MTTGAAAVAFRALILGPPASGKGTISGRIKSKFDFHHISSGDLLRWNIEKATGAGKKAVEFMKTGELVPDNVVIECMLDKIDHEPHPRILLDGFPRTRTQAVALEKVFKLDAILHLIVPYEIIVERTKSRWIHLASGRTYNIGFNDPKVPFKDDETGEALVQRPDDKPDVVTARLKHYDELTKPVLEFYKFHNIVNDFRGETSAAIWPEVERFLLAQSLRPV